MKIRKTSVIAIVIALLLIVGVTTVFATDGKVQAISNTEEKSQNDEIIKYDLPNTKNNQGSYSDQEYEIFLSLKTPSYEKQTVANFNKQLAQKIETNLSIFANSGFNGNTENLEFFKSHKYSLTEIMHDEDGEKEYRSSIGTATNKRTTEGIYCGAGVSYTVFWTIPNKNAITVEERDDALNGFEVQFGAVLDSKNMHDLSAPNVKAKLQSEMNELGTALSSDKIRIRCEVEEVTATDADTVKKFKVVDNNGTGKLLDVKSNRGETLQQGTKASEKKVSFLWPTVETEVLSGFNEYQGHSGIDIKGIVGTPVYASASGTVITATTGYTGYGIYIKIDHGGGYATLYAHCNELLVTEGESVVAGQIIATIGSTGNTTDNCLHFELQYNATTADPKDYLFAEDGTIQQVVPVEVAHSK